MAVLIRQSSSKYISLATRVLVLKHLSARAASLIDARSILSTYELSIRDLLDSNDSLLLYYACTMFGNLAHHEPLNVSLLETDPIPRLVALAKYVE